MCDQTLFEHYNANKILGTAINFRYQQEMNEMQPQTFVLQIARELLTRISNSKRYVKTKR